jgi:hypothetical protein
MPHLPNLPMLVAPPQNTFGNPLQTNGIFWADQDRFNTKHAPHHPCPLLARLGDIQVSYCMRKQFDVVFIECGRDFTRPHVRIIATRPYTIDNHMTMCVDEANGSVILTQGVEKSPVLVVSRFGSVDDYRNPLELNVVDGTNCGEVMTQKVD